MIFLILCLGTNINVVYQCIAIFLQQIRNRKYQSRESFLVDINQIVKNSELYNGEYDWSNYLAVYVTVS